MESIQIYVDPDKAHQKGMSTLGLGLLLLVISVFVLTRSRGNLLSAVGGAFLGGGSWMLIVGLIRILRSTKYEGIPIAVLAPEGLHLIVPQQQFGLKVDTTTKLVPWEDITHIGSRRISRTPMVTIDLISTQQVTATYSRKQQSALRQAKRLSSSDLTISAGALSVSPEELARTLEDYRMAVLIDRQES